jgi:hypothetical protein
MQEVINIKSIQTTMRYSQHRLSDVEKANAIDLVYL